MTAAEFRRCLDRLALTYDEAAKFLSVSSRTVRRWATSQTEIPGTVGQVLSAWMRLEGFGHPWRPDGIPIDKMPPEKVAEQIALFRAHSLELDSLLRRVKARGGPATVWNVDLERHRATLGSKRHPTMRVSFYPLPNGGFSPSTYSRTDRSPDLDRDSALLEDAFACIAEALSAQRRKGRRRKSIDRAE